MEGTVPEDGLEDLYDYRESLIVFYRLSFREFLEDHTRSGRFSISLQTMNDNLWEIFFDTLIDSLNGTDISTSFIFSLLMTWKEDYT